MLLRQVIRPKSELSRSDTISDTSKNQVMCNLLLTSKLFPPIFQGRLWFELVWTMVRWKAETALLLKRATNCDSWTRDRRIANKFALLCREFDRLRFENPEHECLQWVYQIPSTVISSNRSRTIIQPGRSTVQKMCVHYTLTWYYHTLNLWYLIC